MIKFITIIFAAFVFVGCTSAYDVTLNNGALYSGVSKPKLDRERGVYVFKNVTGRSFTIPETRVRTIEPHANAKDKQKQFQNQNDFNSSGR